MSFNEENLNDYPALQKAGKHDPFRAPDGYFESLPNAISEQIHAKAPKPLLTPAVRFVSLSLSVVAMLLISVWVAREPEVVQPAAHAVITDEHIDEAGYLGLMDESLLVESLSASDLEDLSQDADFHEYLIENKTEMSLIINEL